MHIASTNIHSVIIQKDTVVDIVQLDAFVFYSLIFLDIVIIFFIFHFRTDRPHLVASKQTNAVCLTVSVFSYCSDTPLLIFYCFTFVSETSPMQLLLHKALVSPKLALKCPTLPLHAEFEELDVMSRDSLIKARCIRVFVLLYDGDDEGDEFGPEVQVFDAGTLLIWRDCL